MNDYSVTMNVMLHNYMKYRESAHDKTLSYRTRMMYDGFRATREQCIIDLANKIINEREKYYGIL